jgi:hypothetical protein
MNAAMPKQVEAERHAPAESGSPVWGSFYGERAVEALRRNMTPGKYQLTATRGENELLRQGFNNHDEASAAAAEALVRYPECEIRLTQVETVLLSVGPSKRMAR